MMPQTQGASQVYTTYIKPFLDTHDEEIDDYIVTGLETLKELGADYLTRSLYYAREYASHFMFQTEVRPYQPSTTTFASSSNHNEKLSGSYMDNFFSRLKQPPSFSLSMDDPASSQSSTTKPVFLSEPSTDNLGPSLWNSVFKAGAAVLQSSLSQHKPLQQHLSQPTVSSFARCNEKSEPPADSLPDKSFSSMLNALNDQLQTNNASPADYLSTGVDLSSGSAPSSTGVKSRSEMAQTAAILNADVRVSLSQVPSSTSLNSDNEFDIIKHEETGPDADETSSLLTRNPHSPTSPAAGDSRGWFGWKKSRNENEFPKKSVKLEWG